MSEMRVTHPFEVLHGGGVALACNLEGEVRADELHGLFAGDTRVLSSYQITVAGHRWQLLGRQRSGNGTATWKFQSPRIRDPERELPAGSMFLDLRRRVAGALHDDITINTFAPGTIRTRLVLQLDADFADIFEVKQQSLPPRLDVQRTIRRDGLSIAYQRSDFRRALHVTLQHSTAAFQVVGSLVVFDLELVQGLAWCCCVDAQPEIDGMVIGFSGDPHDEEQADDRVAVQLRADSVLQAPFERGCEDLCALAVPIAESSPYVAAGVPWFLSLFGRDSLMTALMTGLIGTWPAEGALAALGALQATERDDWRDAEPGKLPHELRRGELAHFHKIPHTPYYGAHDVPALFCLALWHAWRWTGDVPLLETYVEPARRALQWCDELGDRDGDGLQEYETRSPQGYYNQSWKDAGDAILYDDGSLAELPLATIELQGYLYAARLAFAEVLDACAEHRDARRLRAGARHLQALVEDRYWLDEQGFYAVALDGHKHAVTSVTSNPGHLLWAGLPTPSRARFVARRLLAPDLSTGWGVRTLSSEHSAYNPLSYQRGSVWPHDTMLAAAGMWRYGFRDEGATLIRAVLEAAGAFEDARLPELFCGFDRTTGPPVPYIEANVPQAWAAAVPITAAQLFLGLIPDAPRHRYYLSPWLPDWLPRLEARGIQIGDGTLDLVVEREGAKTIIASIDSTDIEVIQGQPPAPLWGQPTTQ